MLDSYNVHTASIVALTSNGCHIQAILKLKKLKYLYKLVSSGNDIFQNFLENPSRMNQKYVLKTMMDRRSIKMFINSE